MYTKKDQITVQSFKQRSFSKIYLFVVPFFNITYLGSSVESTEKDIETRLTKAWTAINRLSIIWKSDLTDKMKRSFFQAAVTSILLYGCTTWTLTKRLEKKLDGNYTRMLRAILNKSWQQHPTRHQLYGHLPPITNTIQVRRTRHAGHCWRSRDELIRDVLLWIPTHGRAKAGRPARTYIQQLCEDTGCCPEDLPRAMNDREEWRERVRDIRATSAIWWWLCIYVCMCVCVCVCVILTRQTEVRQKVWNWSCFDIKRLNCPIPSAFLIWQIDSWPDDFRNKHREVEWLFKRVSLAALWGNAFSVLSSGIVGVKWLPLP